MIKAVIYTNDQLLALIKAGLEHDDVTFDRIVLEVINVTHAAGHADDARGLTKVFNSGKKKRADKAFSEECRVHNLIEVAKIKGFRRG